MEDQSPEADLDHRGFGCGADDAIIESSISFETLRKPTQLPDSSVIQMLRAW